jgi:hypothetical protein
LGNSCIQSALNEQRDKKSSGEIEGELFTGSGFRK